jgi:hypothetical protein
MNTGSFDMFDRVNITDSANRMYLRHYSPGFTSLEPLELALDSTTPGQLDDRLRLDNPERAHCNPWHTYRPTLQALTLRDVPLAGIILASSVLSRGYWPARRARIVPSAGHEIRKPCAAGRTEAQSCTMDKSRQSKPSAEDSYIDVSIAK